jgi:hypothetical protein
MKVIAALVVGSDGHTSVWPLDDPDPNRDQGAMMNYCLRVHGVFHELVTAWEARQEAQAAFEQGKAAGIALCQISGAGTLPAGCQSSCANPPVSVGNGNDRA